jgi:hypothetical protein
MTAGPNGTLHYAPCLKRLLQLRKKWDDNLFRFKEKMNLSSQAQLFPSCRPKWYPALLQSRSHASAAVLAQEEKGTTLVVFKGEQNKWSSLWVEEVVPWSDRRPEEISDKMDLPQEYARIVDWARAEHDWLCRFDEKGGYKVKHYFALLALFEWLGALRQIKL